MKPDAWSSPRAYRDPALRSQHYGPLVPLAANDNHPWAGQFWRSLGTAVLVGATCFAVGMAFLAVGVL